MDEGTSTKLSFFQLKASSFLFAGFVAKQDCERGVAAWVPPSCIMCPGRPPALHEKHPSDGCHDATPYNTECTTKVPNAVQELALVIAIAPATSVMVAAAT